MASTFSNPTLTLSSGLWNIDLESEEIEQSDITESAQEMSDVEQYIAQFNQLKEIFLYEPENKDDLKSLFNDLANQIILGEKSKNIITYQLPITKNVDLTNSQVAEILKIEDKSTKMNQTKSFKIGFYSVPTILLSGLILLGLGFNFGIGIIILSLSALGLSFFGYWIESGIEIVNIRILTAFTIGTFLISLLNFAKNIF